jgi:hypothetical protein
VTNPSGTVQIPAMLLRPHVGQVSKTTRGTFRTSTLAWSGFSSGRLNVVLPAPYSSEDTRSRASVRRAGCVAGSLYEIDWRQPTSFRWQGLKMILGTPR